MQKLVAALSLASLSLAGCSMLPTAPSDTPDTAVTASAPVQSGEPAAAPDKPVEYAAFPPDILYALLTAEIAGQRGRYDITLVNYVQAARKSKDLGVIRRAMQIARALGGDNAQLQLAQAWLDVEPDNVEPLQIAAVQSIRQKKYETALEYMERILNLGGDADFDHLAAHAKTLSGEERAELIRLYEALRQRHPNNPEVRYSVALLQQSNGMPTHAMDTLKPLLDEYPDFQPAILLYGALMFERGDKEAALSYVRRNTRRYPDSHRLGTLYARMLVEDRQLQAAEDEFLALTKRFPDQPGLRLSFALVALENNHLDLAEKTLRELIGAGHHVQEAHYYLGRIAEDRDQRDQAIDHYQQIESGPHYLSALSRLSLLMARNGELTSVLDRLHTLRTQQPQQSENFWLIEVNLLNELQERTAAVRSASEALTAYPDNLRLRYTRAMLLDEQTEFDMIEADLRYILEREPDNAVALNALGYTLTLRRERLDEALALITRALTLDPENPAIIDSMGWVQYLLGNLGEALKYLKDAYNRYPDPEVAAHYSEVLWASGDREGARTVWNATLKTHPGNTLILETRQRLEGQGTP